MITSARLVQFLAAMLAAYGATYGPSPSNLVFLVGAALVVLLTLAIFVRERNALRAVWPALLGFALLFAVSGLPTLGRPECTNTQTGSSIGGCVESSARAVEIAAIVLMCGALAAAAIDWRRSSINAA
jgi:hypothetical protein